MKNCPAKKIKDIMQILNWPCRWRCRPRVCPWRSRCWFAAGGRGRSATRPNPLASRTNTPRCSWRDAGCASPPAGRSPRGPPSCCCTFSTALQHQQRECAQSQLISQFAAWAAPGQPSGQRDARAAPQFPHWLTANTLHGATRAPRNPDKNVNYNSKNLFNIYGISSTCLGAGFSSF